MLQRTRTQWTGLASSLSLVTSELPYWAAWSMACLLTSLHFSSGSRNSFEKVFPLWDVDVTLLAEFLA